MQGTSFAHVALPISSWSQVNKQSEAELGAIMTKAGILARNSSIQRLITTLDHLRGIPEAGAISIKLMKSLRPIALPECIDRHVLFSVIGSRGIISAKTLEAESKGQIKRPMMFTEALQLGFEKESLDIYLAGNEAQRNRYLRENSQEEILGIACRHCIAFDATKSTEIVILIAKILERFPEYAGVDQKK